MGLSLSLSLMDLPPASLGKQNKTDYNPPDAPSKSVCQQDGMTELRGQQQSASNRRNDRVHVRAGRREHSSSSVFFFVLPLPPSPPSLIPRATITYANKPSSTSFPILAWLPCICSTDPGPLLPKLEQLSIVPPKYSMQLSLSPMGSPPHPHPPLHFLAFIHIVYVSSNFFYPALFHTKPFTQQKIDTTNYASVKILGVLTC